MSGRPGTASRMNMSGIARPPTASNRQPVATRGGAQMRPGSALKGPAARIATGIGGGGTAGLLIYTYIFNIFILFLLHQTSYSQRWNHCHCNS